MLIGGTEVIGFRGKTTVKWDARFIEGRRYLGSTKKQTKGYRLTTCDGSKTNRPTKLKAVGVLLEYYSGKRAGRSPKELALILENSYPPKPKKRKVQIAEERPKGFKIKRYKGE